MKINLLHIVLSLETGGLENGIVNLINQTDDSFNIDVLCLHTKGELVERITNKNTQVLFYDSKQSIINAIKKVKKACDSKKYHIVHSHGFTTMLAGYIAKKLSHIPILINGEHGVLYHNTLKQRLIQRYLFNRMELNLTVSSELKNEIFRRFKINRHNFKTIINGVNSEKFSPQKEIRSSIRDELGIDSQKIVIGSAGRLEEVKNYPLLLNAFSLIYKNKNVVLVLTGDGSEKVKLTSLAQSLNIQDSIIFLGRRNDIDKVMNAYDIFVLPSIYEGLSNTILEAMSCGLPIVASDVGGNSEITEDGFNGYLFPSNNKEVLVDKLNKLIDDPKKLAIFGENSRKRIINEFTLEKMVDNYNNVYKLLFKKKFSSRN